jgi:alginate O-acetyltransferase complex protein AlgI
MTFTSAAFVCFFILFFILYWSVNKNLKLQNILILVASYVFYGWWDYRFLFLMFFSSMVDFIIGYYIYQSTVKLHRRILMATALVMNLGLLFYFKYYNFFVGTFSDMLISFGMEPDKMALDVLLPVGISFYTFQTLSYSLDVYKNKLKPTSSILDFLSFVSFFPQLVAGPIERAGKLLPQISKSRVFNYEQAASGVRLILYGFFKKLVVADTLASRVSMIFDAPEKHTGIETVVGAMFFLIQLYLDFSAYSDIAKGTARILGVELMTNFETPFFATSIPEFWRRWHISLTTWFRDYLFVPIVKLNFDNVIWRVFSTVFLFVVIGFWHGANMTFIIFGTLMGICFIPTHLSKKINWIKQIIKQFNTNPYLMPIAAFFTFTLVALISVLFRSNNVKGAMRLYENILHAPFWGMEEYMHRVFPLLIGFFIFEWFMRNKEYQFDIKKFPKLLRVVIYSGLIIAILLFGNFGEEPFYYFQF